MSGTETQPTLLQVDGFLRMAAMGMANRAEAEQLFDKLGHVIHTEYPALAQKAASFDKMNVLHPAEEWHEDTGPVLWWKLPIDEPPYVGEPGWDTWPGYHTHWSALGVPAQPAGGA